MKKILNQRNTVSFKGNEYEVFIDVSIAETMGWSWDSLMFPDSYETIAYVKDLSCNDFTSLEVDGIVDVYKDDKLLDSDEVTTLAFLGDIHCGDYDIANTNHFSLKYGNVDNQADLFTCSYEEVFIDKPKSIDKLINILLDAHTNYFNN